ncbi:hypothetical protein [Streptomyces lydicus]|uniref:hypothetical protein n=1 Tax=Streptomyces lydicus TaxID=47763 RepID=UPI0005258F97|nr:hypothetical protein [Streptomyces lydicus]MDC7337049.1 hypothetical protein [Streptomyces lydicus]UEG93586.1 hypothetical protein LJ741_25430 [Streptomyces lydicus]
MSAIPRGAGPRLLATSRRRAALKGAACVGLVAALAGCGGQDPDAGTNGVGKLPAAKIQAKARAAAEHAETVHLSGNVVSQGRTFKLDMSLAKDGAKGELTTKAATFQLLRVGDALYLKADAAFWAGEKGGSTGGNGGAAAQKLGGKYVKVPAADPVYKRFSGFTDKDTLLASLLGLHGKLATGDRSDIDGTRTVRLTAGAGAGGTLDVSLEGTPYPLRLQRAGGAGVVRLAEWGRSVDLRAPSKDQVVDYGSRISSSG